MTNADGCQNRHEAIAALVLGELEGPDAEEISKHIDTCENCRYLYQALTAEEETIQSAFEAVDDRSRELGAGLVEQFAKGSRIAQPEPAIFHRLWTGSGVPKRVAELAAAAAVIIGVFIAIYQFGGSTVAWADVVEKFRSMPFFSASIYFKDDVTSEPRLMELWMSRTGKTRIRLGTQVIFGDRGEIVEAFDIKTRAPVEADELAAFFLKKIGEADEFSLDSIIRVMFGGTMQDVTPLVNPDAVISRDMVVFDVEVPGSTERVRIWALRESRLPVRIKVWNPQGGNSADAIFEYSGEQADEFFDPYAFEQSISSGQTTNMKGPGGTE